MFELSFGITCIVSFVSGTILDLLVDIISKWNDEDEED